MTLEVTIKGQRKLREVAAALRKADRKDLARKLQRAVRKAAKPTLDDIKESARHIDTKGVRKPGAKRRFTAEFPAKGLRAKIAQAVVADIRTTGDDPRVRFRVAKSKLGADIENMPRKLDDPGTFRHPIMGNREAWVSQTGDPWFWKPIEQNIKTFRREIDDALEEIKREIERA